jgi:hypothetical protein
MRYDVIMKRITMMLPEDTLTRLRHESRRRGISVAELVREAVDRHVPDPGASGRLSLFAIGAGGPADASERVGEYVGRAMRRRAHGHR